MAETPTRQARRPEDDEQAYLSGSHGATASSGTSFSQRLRSRLMDGTPVQRTPIRQGVQFAGDVTASVRTAARSDLFSTIGRDHGRTNLGSSQGLGGDATGTDHRAFAQATSGENIYGTLINLDSLVQDFSNFLASFGGGKYAQLLFEMHPSPDGEILSLLLDARDVHAYSPYLYSSLISYPMEVISHLDVLAQRLFSRLKLEELRARSDFQGPADARIAALDATNIQVKIHSLRPTEMRRMRDIGVADICRLVSCKGIVVRAGELKPEILIASFKCTSSAACGNTQAVRIKGGVIEEPTTCDRCHQKMTFQLIHNASSFGDKQIIKLQESPETIPAGETPHTVLVMCYDDLYDSVKPGDRVTVTGICRSQPVRANPTTRAEQAVLRTYIDVLHFATTSEEGYLTAAGSGPASSAGVGSEVRGRAASGAESTAHSEMHQISRNGLISEADKIAMMRQYCEDRFSHVNSTSATSKKIMQVLLSSFAPSIYQLSDVKLGLLVQLVGGAFRENSQIRPEIHVLMCGDPSSAKSQLLTYVHKLSPRGVYTSGKGSSAVGLTAYIRKDTETKDVILESGALVLSDGGVCCIDEFDKMDDSTRSVLHEVMEQQTVSVAKQGLVCSLNARCSICATANPVESKYDTSRSVVENINLPPGLVSRFDLLYLILDLATPAMDRRLATHIISLFAGLPVDSSAMRMSDGESSPLSSDEQSLFSMKELSEYIRVARSVVPSLSPAASEELIASYMQLRGASADRLMNAGGSYSASHKTVTATPRQLESLIRISEALAKLELSETVEVRHVEEGVRLIRSALLSAAVDPRTGRIDMGMFVTGVSELEREIRATADRAMNELPANIKAIIYSGSRDVSSSGVKSAILAKMRELAAAGGNRALLTAILSAPNVMSGSEQASRHSKQGNKVHDIIEETLQEHKSRAPQTAYGAQQVDAPIY